MFRLCAFQAAASACVQVIRVDLEHRQVEPFHMACAGYGQQQDVSDSERLFSHLLSGCCISLGDGLGNSSTTSSSSGLGNGLGKGLTSRATTPTCTHSTSVRRLSQSVADWQSVCECTFTIWTTVCIYDDRRKGQVTTASGWPD